MDYKTVNMNLIDDEDFKMRLNLDDPEFVELCQSILRDGVIQPVILRKTDNGYAVIAGHRRTAAAKESGLQVIPALVVEADDAKAWNLAFAENLFRKDLTAIEEAGSIKDCIDSGMYTVETIAKILRRSVGWVCGRLELIGWSPILQQAVHAGVLSVSAARWIAKIDDSVQVELLTGYAVDNGATERSTQAWYQSWLATKTTISPEEIEPLETASKVRLPEPQSPCVICQNVEPMRNLSYLPVCSGCGENLIAIARGQREGP